MLNFILPATVLAQIVDNDCGGSDNPCTPNTLTDLEGIFTNVIGLLIPFGGILLFVMLLYGGIQYITSGPNPGNVEKAKATLTYAIIGTVLLSMAFLILVLIRQITGANVTEFSFDVFSE